MIHNDGSWWLMMADDGEPIAGWWFFAYPSEKYEFVNCDDDIPN